MRSKGSWNQSRRGASAAPLLTPWTSTNTNDQFIRRIEDSDVVSVDGTQRLGAAIRYMNIL